MTEPYRPRCECGATWGGLNTCHCASCHLTFTGVTAFDLHRRTGRCQDPRVAGLALADRDYECWGSPEHRPEASIPADRPDAQSVGRAVRVPVSRP